MIPFMFAKVEAMFLKLPVTKNTGKELPEHRIVPTSS